MLRSLHFVVLVGLAMTLIACESSAPHDEIGEEEAIQIALEELAKVTDEKPDQVTAEIQNVLADADDIRERVWSVRFELPHGTEEGVYIDPATGEVLGGWSGES